MKARKDWKYDYIVFQNDFWMISGLTCKILLSYFQKYFAEEKKTLFIGDFTNGRLRNISFQF